MASQKYWCVVCEHWFLNKRQMMYLFWRDKTKQKKSKLPIFIFRLNAQCGSFCPDPGNGGWFWVERGCSLPYFRFNLLQNESHENIRQPCVWAVVLTYPFRPVGLFIFSYNKQVVICKVYCIHVYNSAVT